MPKKSSATSQQAPLASATKRAKRFWHNNGLSIALFVLFAASLLGQSLTGWHDENNSRMQHSQPAVALGDYVSSAHFLEATMENFESEFLQMFVYVVFTIFLFQRGSSESKDPNSPSDPEPPLTSRSPSLSRTRGWRRKLYENSMSLAFLLLFVATFVLHAVGGVGRYNEEQLAHGYAPISVLAYMCSSRFWFESLQNWQSEFLSLWAMVVMSIYLRQRGSPESKPVSSPHDQTGR